MVALLAVARVEMKPRSYLQNCLLCGQVCRQKTQIMKDLFDQVASVDHHEKCRVVADLEPMVFLENQAPVDLKFRLGRIIAWTVQFHNCFAGKQIVVKMGRFADFEGGIATVGSDWSFDCLVD